MRDSASKLQELNLGLFPLKNSKAKFQIPRIGKITLFAIISFFYIFFDLFFQFSDFRGFFSCDRDPRLFPTNPIGFKIHGIGFSFLGPYRGSPNKVNFKIFWNSFLFLYLCFDQKYFPYKSVPGRYWCYRVDNFQKFLNSTAKFEKLSKITRYINPIPVA